MGLSPEEQKVASASIIGQKLSVRETESLIKRLKGAPAGSSASLASDSPDSKVISLLGELAEVFQRQGVRAAVKGVKVVLDFREEEEVRKLIKSLSKLSF